MLLLSRFLTVPYFRRVQSMARCVFEIWSVGSCRVSLLRNTVEIEMKGGYTIIKRVWTLWSVKSV